MRFMDFAKKGTYAVGLTALCSNIAIFSLVGYFICWAHSKRNVDF